MVKLDTRRCEHLLPHRVERVGVDALFVDGHEPQRHAAVLRPADHVLREHERIGDELPVCNVGLGTVEVQASFVRRDLGTDARRVVLDGAFRKRLREQHTAVTGGEVFGNLLLGERAHGRKQRHGVHVGLVRQDGACTARETGDEQSAYDEGAIPSANLRGKAVVAELAFVEGPVVGAWDTS